MSYDPGFYDQIRPGVQASAAVVVPHVVSHMSRPPRTVLDVGCGEGWWAAAFRADSGADVVGLDGGYVAPQAFGVEEFCAWDLAEPLPTAIRGRERFELVVCLEVAEHLPAARAESFVADLCRLGESVLFSAAIPGQGGVGHENEQWPSWWAALFEGRGYEVTGALRCGIWTDERVEPWYRQNLLVATRSTARLWALLPDEPMLDVVHPAIYGWRLAERDAMAGG